MPLHRSATWAGVVLALAVGTSAAVTPDGAEFPVNSFTTGTQTRPSVAMTADGGFLVLWDSIPGASGNGTYAQRFDASGAPLGGEVFLASGGRPSVALAPDGSFVMAFTADDGHDEGIFARRLEAGGDLEELRRRFSELARETLASQDRLRSG